MYLYLKIEILIIYFIINFHIFLLEHRFKKILLFIKIIYPDNKSFSKFILFLNFYIIFILFLKHDLE